MTKADLVEEVVRVAGVSKKHAETVVAEPVAGRAPEA